MIDITSTAIVLALMAAFCLPFIRSHQMRNKHKNLLLNEFMLHANSFNLKINVYDLWRRSYAIGIDEVEGRLLYMKFHPEPHSELIDLKTIKRISISKQERTIGSGKQLTRVVEKLFLVLDSSDSPTYFLEFYDSDVNMGLSGEPVLIQKWHDNIQTRLARHSEKREYAHGEIGER